MSGPSGGKSPLMRLEASALVIFWGVRRVCWAPNSWAKGKLSSLTSVIAICPAPNAWAATKAFKPAHQILICYTIICFRALSHWAQDGGDPFELGNLKFGLYWWRLTNPHRCWSRKHSQTARDLSRKGDWPSIELCTALICPANICARDQIPT